MLLQFDRIELDIVYAGDNGQGQSFVEDRSINNNQY